MNAWLTLPWYLFGRGVGLRNRLYNSGLLEAKSVACPVVSIGNITVGGTGKTPFSIWLLKRMQEKGISAGVRQSWLSLQWWRCACGDHGKCRGIWR